MDSIEMPAISEEWYPEESEKQLAEGFEDFIKWCEPQGIDQPLLYFYVKKEKLSCLCKNTNNIDAYAIQLENFGVVNHEDLAAWAAKVKSKILSEQARELYEFIFKKSHWMGMISAWKQSSNEHLVQTSLEILGQWLEDKSTNGFGEFWEEQHEKDPSKPLIPKPTKTPRLRWTTRLKKCAADRICCYLSIVLSIILGIAVAVLVILGDFSEEALRASHERVEIPVNYCNNTLTEFGSPLEILSQPSNCTFREMTIIVSEDNYEKWREWKQSTHAPSANKLTLVGVISQEILAHILKVIQDVHLLNLVPSPDDRTCQGSHGIFLPAESTKILSLHLNLTSSGSCSKFLAIFTRIYFKHLERLIFTNLEITADNERYVRLMLSLYDQSLTSAAFHIGQQSFLSRIFDGLYFYSMQDLTVHFLEPASKISQTMYFDLNFRTPNVVEVYSNVVCNEQEVRHLLTNWRFLPPASEICHLE